jgi:hypothetical protein
MRQRIYTQHRIQSINHTVFKVTLNTWCAVSRTPGRGTSCVVGNHQFVRMSAVCLSAGFPPLLSWYSYLLSVFYFINAPSHCPKRPSIWHSMCVWGGGCVHVCTVPNPRETNWEKGAALNNILSWFRLQKSCKQCAGSDGSVINWPPGSGSVNPKISENSSVFSNYCIIINNRFDNIFLSMPT